MSTSLIVAFSEFKHGLILGLFMLGAIQALVLFGMFGLFAFFSVLTLLLLVMP